MTTTDSGYAQGARSNQRDFDFTLGEWDADITRYDPNGSVAAKTEGSWSARASLGGRVIEDHFVQKVDGGDDLAAVTVRTYCEETRRWEMVYLWAGQPATSLVAFVGNRVGDEMHLNLQLRGRDGLVVLRRIRFFDITGERFSWEDQTSADNGATWFRATLLKMRRRSGGS